MGTMTDETYNGYANRETWAFNLHWSNDQGLYNETLQEARQYLEDTYGDEWASLPNDELEGAAYGVGECIVNYWKNFIEDYAEDFGAEPPESLTLFYREVGSWWRLDYLEIGQSVLESLGNES